MTVSVVIPSYNRTEEVQHAIRSVMQQNYSPVEIIVVDDGSSDGTSSMLREKFPHITVVTNPKSVGGAAARNIGASHASGTYLAFLDSDDEWLPGHLTQKIELIEKEKADGAYGTFYLCDGRQEREIKFGMTNPPSRQIGNLILNTIRFDARTSTFVFKRDAFMKVRFDDSLRKHQDWDLAINFDQHFKFVLDPVPSVKIHVGTERERMSHKLNHDASFYFLKRNTPYIRPDNIFIFCMKQIMRCQFQGEPRSVVDRYLEFAGGRYPQLTLRNKIIYQLIRFRLVNLGLVYKIKKRIQ